MENRIKELLANISQSEFNEDDFDTLDYLLKIEEILKDRGDYMPQDWFDRLFGWMKLK